jgi:uncharacterized membrane protein
MRRALLAMLVAVAACGGRPSQPAPPAQDATADGAVAPRPRLRGTLLVRGDSTLVFIACGTVTERALTAPPSAQLDAAVTAVNGELRDSVWVEFVADTARGAITARETLFAASLREGSRCDEPVPSFEIVASGNEPFWRVTFDGTQLVLERPEPPREIVFDVDTSASRGALTTIIGRRALGKVHELKLGLLHEDCRDGMSDAWYPYRAEVHMGDLALHGCARR